MGRKPKHKPGVHRQSGIKHKVGINRTQHHQDKSRDRTLPVGEWFLPRLEICRHAKDSYSKSSSALANSSAPAVPAM